MANGIRTGDPRGFNKGRSLKFHVGSQIRQTPEYVLWPSLGVCRIREPSRNFKLRPLLNPRGSPVLIPLDITGYKC